MSHVAIRDIVAHFFRVCMKQQQFPKRYKQKLEKNKPSSEEKLQTFGQAQDKKKKWPVVLSAKSSLLYSKNYVLYLWSFSLNNNLVS